MDVKIRTSIADGLPYKNFCEQVMNDKTGELLKNFRRNPDYDLVVPGNRCGDEMFEHLDLLKLDYPEMLEFMYLFEKDQGEFGNPRKYQFDVGNFDVPLILHIYYLALTRRYFGDLTGMKILEIGPGVGLFFKVLTDLYNVQYSCVDLKAPLYIVQKHIEFLNRMKFVDKLITCDEVCSDNFAGDEYDLVVSDCAFNELHRDIQEIYLKKLFNKSKRGRIAFYSVDLNLIIPNLNIVQIYEKLDKITKNIRYDLRVPTLYWDETKESPWSSNAQQ